MKNRKILSFFASSAILTTNSLLAQNNTILQDVTVTTASGYEQIIKQAPASISVITAKDLEKKKFNSLHDIVNDIPGVNVIGGGIGSGISIRGMEKGYTLILVDGKRVRSETGNPRELNNEDLDANFIPPLSAIERIEVIRGPMSSLYGSDAMGGVINIITKKTPNKWSGSIEFGYTKPSNNDMSPQKQVDYFLNGPLVNDLLGLQFWGYRKIQEQDKYYGGFQESEKKNVGGKLTLTPNENNDLYVEYSKTSQHYTGTPGETLLPTARSGANREWTRDALSTGYNGRFEIGNIELKYYEEDYERNTFPSNATYTTGSTNKVADGKFVTAISNHMLTTGYQWTKDRLTNNDLGGGKSGSYGTKTISENSYFIEDEWELLDEELFLTVGARLTDNEYFGNHISPRTYLVYNLNTNWTFKGGVATGYKSPKITQIDETTGSQRGGGNSQFLILGNPDLEPEESTNYEIGAYYDNNNNFSSSFTLFRNDFENKIINTSSYMFDNNSGGKISAYCDSGNVGSRNCPAWATWLNLNGALINGFELESKWDITDKLNLKGNYTLAKSEIDAGNVTIKTPSGDRTFGETLAQLDGNSLTGVPEHTASISLNYNPIKSVSTFVRGNYESELTKVSFENNSVSKDENDLLTFDSGVNYKINNNLNLNFTIYNLFDEVRFKQNEETGAVRYTERGRNFWTSLKASF